MAYTVHKSVRGGVGPFGQHRCGGILRRDDAPAHLGGASTAHPGAGAPGHPVRQTRRAYDPPHFPVALLAGTLAGSRLPPFALFHLTNLVALRGLGGLLVLGDRLHRIGLAAVGALALLTGSILGYRSGARPSPHGCVHQPGGPADDPRCRLQSRARGGADDGGTPVCEGQSARQATTPGEYVEQAPARGQRPGHHGDRHLAYG